MFVEIAAPAIVMLDPQLCWVVEYTWGRVYRVAVSWALLQIVGGDKLIIPFC